MSSGGGSSAPGLAGRLRSKRNKLRNGTFVIPSTGERSRRQFTLRTSSLSNDGDDATGYRSMPYSQSIGEHARNIAHNSKVRAIALWRWLNSDEGHGVLKCTLAYLLGSCGTFFPPLSEYLGHRDGKHITATLTVYFHPARTVGSMLEAVLIAIVAVFYATLVCLASMMISVYFQAKWDLVELAHFLVLFFSVGGGLGFVGWVKQRLNQPLVSVACTLASIAIITVVTKEEAIYNGYINIEKITQMMKMLVIGISCTFFVNLVLWQVSARRVLRRNMQKATMALADKLSLITNGFINGSEEDLESAAYGQVTGQYNGAYAQITKTLREAKFEHYFHGNERIYPLDKRLVKSIEALTQSIGGLRSALDTQFTLLKETPAGDQPDGAPSGSGSVRRPQPSRAMSVYMEDARDRLSVIDESQEEDADAPRVLLRSRTQGEPTGTPPVNTPLFTVPSDIFALFIALLGPSMKSLAYTLSETLREPPFGQDPQKHIVVNDQLRSSLRDALGLYNQARRNALQELYRSIELGRSRSEKIQADIEEVAASCGHFSFSLQAVAEEMHDYLDVLEDLKLATETGPLTWKWLKFWQRWTKPTKKVPDPLNDAERDTLLNKPPVKRLRNSAVPKGIPDTMIQRRDTFNWDAAPQYSKFLRVVSKVLLKFMRFLTQDDILFGIKVGIGAILWAQLAFIPSTREVYQHWRGEWGLLSFMIVVAMTTGAANTTGNARFLGTIIGGISACVSWVVCRENPFALAFFGWMMALWNFYIILVVKNAPLGRITLLAYNVVVLYAYSLSQKVDDDDDDEGGASPLIWDITYHRVVSVTLGIIWGITVCRVLWPISGRRKFREGLSVLYLQLGLIWKRGPVGFHTESSSTIDYMREGEQAALQRYAFKLESLRTSAKSEFELRGPFPEEAYGRIMRSTKHILDGFYAMRLISHKSHILSDGERALLEFTAADRALLCQRICQIFQVLASCIMLEYPLTDAIPPVESSKDRLLGRIYWFRKEHMGSGNEASGQPLASPSSTTGGGAAAGLSNGSGAGPVAEEKDYALVYAYTLVTAQVAEELKKVRAEIEGLFGVLNEEALLLE